MGTLTEAPRAIVRIKENRVCEVPVTGEGWGLLTQPPPSPLLPLVSQVGPSLGLPGPGCSPLGPVPGCLCRHCSCHLSPARGGGKQARAVTRLLCSHLPLMLWPHRRLPPGRQPGLWSLSQWLSCRGLGRVQAPLCSPLIRGAGEAAARDALASSPHGAGWRAPLPPGPQSAPLPHRQVSVPRPWEI